MKKNKYLALLAASLLLVGCGTVASSNEPVSEATSSSEVVEATTEEQTTTSEEEVTTEEVTSEEKEVVLNLDGLKSGYRSKNAYASVTTYSPDTVPSYSFDKLTETYMQSDVVKFVKYNGSSWDKATLSSYIQYELNAENKVVTTSVNLAGERVEKPTNFQDKLLNAGDPDISWKDACLENAYLSLEVSDFTKQEDGSYSLNIADIEASADEEKVSALDRLSDQLYLYVNGSSTGEYFMEDNLASFVLNVDEEGNPVSFIGEYSKSEKWGSYKYQAVQGTYEEVGSNLASKVESYEKKYEELDAKLESLAKHNYQFHARATVTGYSSATYSYILNGKANGASFEVSKTSFSWDGKENGVATTGYNQLEDGYRKYNVVDGVGTYSGTLTEGLATSFLPNFSLFSSALFVKEENSVANLSVYRLVKPELFQSITAGEVFNNFGVSATPTYSAITDFVIIVTPEAVTFKNVNGENTATYEFYNIGNAKISTTVEEAA